MSKTALWHVENKVPHPLSESSFNLEKQLETWIEDNPSLLRGDLTIVGRQFYTESGPIDLLARDPNGRWVVIELKAGAVRRGTITQALDYAACIKKCRAMNCTRK
jgi:RecB family endonuclease NucS